MSETPLVASVEVPEVVPPVLVVLDVPVVPVPVVPVPGGITGFGLSESTTTPLFDFFWFARA